MSTLYGMLGGIECLGKEESWARWRERRCSRSLHEAVSPERAREVSGCGEVHPGSKVSPSAVNLRKKPTGLGAGLGPFRDFQSPRIPDCNECWGQELQRSLSFLQTPHTAGRGMATLGSSKAWGARQMSLLPGLLDSLGILFSMKC